MSFTNAQTFSTYIVEWKTNNRVCRLMCPAMLSLLILVTACGVDPWPEESDQMRSTYFDNQAQFFQLFEEVKAAGYERVDVKDGQFGVRVSVPSDDPATKTMDQTSDVAAESISALMIQIGVSSASISHDELRLEVLLPYERGEHRSAYYVTNTGDNQSMLDSCSNFENDTPEHGMCQIVLNRSWRIEYSW